MGLRKSFVGLTEVERTRLASAFNKVEASGFIAAMADEHNANFNGGIHWGSAFLPWHRHFLLRLETELQNVEHPDVTIPYWDWTHPDLRSLDAEPMKSFFSGRNNTGGEFDHWTYNRAPEDPPETSTEPSEHLPVLVADGTSPARSIVDELNKPSFAEFRSLEALGSHPPGHVWTGGTMAGGRSPADPLFWLHHCNIDRLWAIWQQNNRDVEQYNTLSTPGDRVPAAMVPLNSPMVAGATPASMLDHVALGFTYPTDERLETAWAEQGLGTLVTGDPVPTATALRHVVVFTWRPEATEDQKQALVDELRKLPSAISEIRAYRFGPDAGLGPGNYDFAVVADFDDVTGYQAYRDHPEHQAVIEQHIRPILDQRAAVQFELEVEG